MLDRQRNASQVDILLVTPLPPPDNPERSQPVHRVCVCFCAEAASVHILFKRFKRSDAALADRPIWLSQLKDSKIGLCANFPKYIHYLEIYFCQLKSKYSSQFKQLIQTLRCFHILMQKSKHLKGRFGAQKPSLCAY